MSETRHTADHEWARVEQGDIAVVGITDFAQEQLGDIVFIELPKVGESFYTGDEVAVIESVKTAADFRTPLSGEIVEVNETLVETPELINDSPTDEGWICKVLMSDLSEIETMMEEEEYKDYISNLD